MPIIQTLAERRWCAAFLSALDAGCSRAEATEFATSLYADAL